MNHLQDLTLKWEMVDRLRVKLEKNKVPPKQVLSKIEFLANHPEIAMQPCNKMKNLNGLYKYRAGSLRIIYTFKRNSDALVMLVVDASYRKDVYHKLKR
jgi:mRNA-degrading endonuclease RelE of RelBE toxin-antitoxin system